MKEIIRQYARELGFDDCRVTTAQPPESAARFRQWLAEGRHGEMGYLPRNAEKRIDPQRVLPGARSLFVLAASYSGKETESSKEATAAARRKAEVRSAKFEDRSPIHGFEPQPSSRVATERTRTQDGCGTLAPEFGIQNHCGVIARYARFNDYHQVLGERLKLLAEFMNQLGGEGTRSLWYVDTGPVLERDMAQRAGLGFIGKHTNLISRQLGNWLFLSEIITTLELEPDPPEKNRCGSCTRCLEACPTQAIKAPFQLDARRCISYLTIELKGSIPPDLRPAIGNRIYGCDDCLAACPWNRFAQHGQLMKAHARSELATPDLLGLLSLDEAGFKRRFVGTPMLRTKRRGLLRNVCVALGNVGDNMVLPALQTAVRDPEPLIAEHARWAVGQIEARAADRQR